MLIVTGLAAAFTESISMGAVAYTSFGLDHDFYLAERRREQSDIANKPEEEREEIRQIYVAKGFEGQLLEDVVDTITSNRETWVSMMRAEELNWQAVPGKSLIRSALVMAVATLIGHLIPIMHFGQPVILADGEFSFSPTKFGGSGLYDAFAGNLK